MSVNGRPKRAAAQARQILISDDSDDEIVTPKRKVTKDNDLSYQDSDIDTPPARPIKKIAKPRKAAVKSDKPSPKKRSIPAKRAEPKEKATPKKRVRPAASVKSEVVPSKRAKLSDDTKVDSTDGGCISSLEAPVPVPAAPPKSKVKKPSSAKANFSKFNSGKSWTESQLLSDLQNIDYQTAHNIIDLFNDDNTIPFICRYRKELIGDISPDKLRDIKISFNHILNIKSRAETIIKNLEKDDHLTDDIRSNILCAKSLDELDHLYAPYKPASKLSLFERAKSIGLLPPAEQILYGQPCKLQLHSLLNGTTEGLETIEKITDGIKHVIAHIISKDTRVLEEIRNLQKFHRIMMQSKMCKPTAATTKKTASDTGKTAGKKKEEKFTKPVDPSKFETYFDFKNAVRYIKPHQVLAMNRGENLKVLSIKIDIPDAFKNDVHNYVRNEYLRDGIPYPERYDLFQSSFEEAYTKKLQPLISRQIRSELTKMAEAASVEVFATNLKQLLLMSPVKGERILGIDPGFSNGCKIAVISECTDVLDTAVMYPHTQPKSYLMYGERLAMMMRAHQCKLIALGNGTACRETEKWISDLFKEGVLDSRFVKYSIVTEQGASIYSCGDIAKKEFPTLDVNLISAVSIARRLNDPLGEFVKVEPKHLGVGMYQHDVNEKLLSESLNEVVMECVSFVGVDINTASVALLRHVAGLTAVRAENIIKHRSEKGPFKSREELKKVKQIGDKTFVQCAGFIRIEPLTAGIQDYNLLDSTWVHPESYDLAKKIIQSSGQTVKQIGSPMFIHKIQEYSLRNPLTMLAKTLNKPEERIQSVLDALQRELLRDYRTDFDKKPLFKQGLTKMADLHEGTCVSGAITNITHFGCFVDIGVEKDGLIHVSQMGGMKPNIGDAIEALVMQVDIARGRIQLKLKNIC